MKDACERLEESLSYLQLSFVISNTYYSDDEVDYCYCFAVADIKIMDI